VILVKKEKHFRVSCELARQQLISRCSERGIPNEAEGSRDETFKLTRRDPSTAARDDGEWGGERKLGGFCLLPETPAAVCDTQFCYVFGVEWDVGMAAHRCDQ
jgi:hypothetical protein